VLRIAPEGSVSGNAVLVVVGLGIALAAELLFAFLALIAMLAAIDQAADRDRIADLKAGDRAAYLDHTADDLVAGHDGIHAPAPIVAGLVKVGVADAAVQDLHHDIVRARRAPLE